MANLGQGDINIIDINSNTNPVETAANQQTNQQLTEQQIQRGIENFNTYIQQDNFIVRNKL